MIDVTKIKIGDTLIHKDKGALEIEGIHPHCGDYMITYKDGWVYLKNCSL